MLNGIVDGCDGQLKYTICDAYRLYHSKCTEASFSPTSTDSLYLQVAQVPRSPDLVIFVDDNDNDNDNDTTA